MDQQSVQQTTSSAAEHTAYEAAVIVRILGGERELFHELIRPYERGLYLAAYGMLQQQEDAEDAVQEAVIKAFKALASFRGESKFSTWLMSITLNEARGKLRKHAGEQLDFLSDNEEEGDYTPSVLADWRYIPSEELERQELRRQLQQAMAQIAPEHREMLILRDVRGLSTVEAAEAAGCSEALAKVRLHRARMAMQKLLAPQLAPKQKGLVGWLNRKAGGR